MGKLQAALAWAGRGFRVFPVEENGKTPLRGMQHTEQATTDEDQIRAWWLDPVTSVERNYNIGFSTSDHVVLDVDIKANKGGLATAQALKIDWVTLVVQTPSGGFHVYYKPYEQPVGQHPLGPGIDVRAWHGYVVAPGSTVNGVEYTVLLDEELTPAPEHLRSLFRAPQERQTTQDTTGEYFDSPRAEALAIEFLASADLSIEGRRGDDTAFRVTAGLRELGVSPAVAVNLLAEHWNSRCEPPWDYEDLEQKVRNVYRYATRAIGSANPEVMFQGVQPVNTPVHDPPPRKFTAYEIGNLLHEDAIRPRPWLLGQWLQRGELTTVVAAPGGGKSLFNLILACHGAVGKAFAGQSWADGSIKAIVYDAEDKLPELSRRVHAICSFYKLDIEQVRRNISLNGPGETSLVITKGSPPTVNKDVLDALKRRVIEQGISLVLLGPLTDMHTAQENDAIQMQYVMAIFADFALTTNTAVTVTHHTAKPPIAASTGWSGSQFAGRGSTAVPAKARIVLTLFPAAPSDVAEGCISPALRERIVKLEVGKNSYGLKIPAWFQWTEVLIKSGDKVGVLAAINIDEIEGNVTQQLGQAIITAIQQRGAGSLSSEEAIAVFRSTFESEKDESAAIVRNRIERLVGKGIRVGEQTIGVQRKGSAMIVAVL